MRFIKVATSRQNEKHNYISLLSYHLIYTLFYLTINRSLNIHMSKPWEEGWPQKSPVEPFFTSERFATKGSSQPAIDETVLGKPISGDFNRKIPWTFTLW